MEIKGIDVSSYQGNIDWATVADYGMGFAILRITEKNNKVDSKFEQNYKGCIKYNIPVGVYKYSYALSVAEIQAEAQGVVDVLDGRELQFPVWLDLEDAKQRSLSDSTLMTMIKTFWSVVTAAGYKFGIYCNMDWYDNVIPAEAKNKYDFWIARYPAQDDGWLQERLRPSVGVGWQYSSKAVIPGIPTKVDRNVFYKDYEEDNASMTKAQIIQSVINDAVDFAVKMANDNKHGYSQAVRSLYNITNPKSFDCSSLVCTAYYYAFIKNGLNKEANYLKSHCSYTGNMLNMTNCGFEIVARNQTAHKEMIKGDIELNTTYHTALAIDKNNIVHARSSEGTSDTKDGSGNEIRIQPWYLYSHGWTHRLRFTGKGVDFSNAKPDTSTSVLAGKSDYTCTPDIVQLGSTGLSVLLLQEILIARGFRGKDGKTLSLDRSAGENTIYALKQYQKSRDGYLEVDGICGTNTWKDLIAIE